MRTVESISSNALLRTYAARILGLGVRSSADGTLDDSAAVTLFQHHIGCALFYAWNAQGRLAHVCKFVCFAVQERTAVHVCADR